MVAQLAAPPAQAAEGECYLVAPAATDAWTTKFDHLALSTGGSWHFIAPSEGLLAFDRDAGCWLCFRAGWQRAESPVVPAGGNVIDVEARAAMLQLIESLQAQVEQHVR